MATAEQNATTIEQEYLRLANDRKPYEDRAEDCSKLSLPSVFAEETFKAQDDLERGYAQGFMADLVKNLVGKLALTILPSTQPFFRLSATEEAMEKVTGNNEDAISEVDKILSTKEEQVMRVINRSRFNKPLYPALKLSVITGNGIIEKFDKNKYKVHNLHNYVIQRDFAGEILRLIIQETKSYETIPEEFKSQLDEDKRDEKVAIYTDFKLEDGKFILRQELLGQPVGQEKTFKSFEDKFIDVGWDRIDGEDYSRGFFEDHLGTVITLDKLMKIVTEGIAESVKIVKCVNPNGSTTYQDYVDAKHGEAIVGDAADVTTIQSDKAQDLSVAKQLIEEIKQELAKSFLSTALSIRDSERTTAHEVQLVAQEAEAGLGGIYTRLSDNIQRPLVNQSLSEIEVTTGNDIDVIITTGLQALGRNVELSKINAMIQELQLLASVVNPEEVSRYVNVGAVCSAIVANSGVASKNFLYTKKEVEAKQAEQQKEAMSQQALGAIMPQAGQNVANQMVPPQQGE